MRERTVDELKNFIIENTTRDEKTGCWVWNASLSTLLGYGRLSFRGVQTNASRISWMVFNNDFTAFGDKTVYIIHSCDNPPCCNPAHLRRGDAKLNVHDCIQRGRRYKANPKPPRICKCGAVVERFKKFCEACRVNSSKSKRKERYLRNRATILPKMAIRRKQILAESGIIKRAYVRTAKKVWE